MPGDAGKFLSRWLAAILALMIPAVIIGIVVLSSTDSTKAQIDGTPRTIHLNITGTPTLSIPHDYAISIYQANGDLPNGDFDGVQFVGITANYSDSGTMNPSETFSANALCVFYDAFRCGDRLFVKELASGEVIEIQGIPLPHRPYSNLRWLDESLLTVDRWSGPHFGIRYVFDVSARAVIVAVPIFDEVYAGTLSMPPE